jgi:HprK-related kinase B
MTPTTIRSIVDDYRAKHPTDKTLGLKFGDLRIDLKTNSDELVAKLDRYFLDFKNADGPADLVVEAIEAPAPDLELDFRIKQPDPGKTKVKEEWIDLPDGRIVRKRLTDMIFCFGEIGHVAIGPCVENDNQVINFINNRFIEHKIGNGSLLFHSAGVAWGERGVCLSGFAGAGKSTLALHIMRLGTDFISNDRVMVQRENGQLTMWGVAKMPRVNPGTVINNPDLDPVIPHHERERFEAMPKEELWDLEYKYDAFIDECFGPGKFKLMSPMAGLVILNWKRTDDPVVIKEVDIRQRRELMPSFMKSVGLFYQPEEAKPDGDATEEEYIELLEGCPVIELSGGVDFEKAARICLEFLKTGKLPS